ncbi:hypothetical protein [Nocardia aurea]|uniref:hypothetical protein n=1 Tax=Nocardia aurea TaxID=2144174 RepID=UPI0033A78D13
MIHSVPSPLAGTTVTADIGKGPTSIRVEDWWDRLAGKSWMVCDGNPAALIFAVRSGLSQLPTDDEVLYGKSADGFGVLVHVSEVTA